MEDPIRLIAQAIINGNHEDVEELTKEGLDAGVAVGAILNQAMIAAMDEVGKKFASGEIYVPEMLVSAFTMKKGMELLKPLLAGEANRYRGKILIGTVRGDLHDIGKNIVVMTLEGAGFEVIDLGVDQDVEDVIRRVEEEQPQILGLSALLTTTMPEMARVIEALARKGLRDQIKVIIGGAPVSAEFAVQVAADGYGRDATEAVALARELIMEPGK